MTKGEPAERCQRRQKHDSGDELSVPAHGPERLPMTRAIVPGLLLLACGVHEARLHVDSSRGAGQYGIPKGQ